MEKDDKGSAMIRMGVSGWMFLLVPAYLGFPGSKAVKRSLYDIAHHTLKMSNCHHSMLWHPKKVTLAVDLYCLWHSQLQLDNLSVHEMKLGSYFTREKMFTVAPLRTENYLVYAYMQWLQPRSMTCAGHLLYAYPIWLQQICANWYGA